MRHIWLIMSSPNGREGRGGMALLSELSFMKMKMKNVAKIVIVLHDIYSNALGGAGALRRE